MEKENNDSKVSKEEAENIILNGKKLPKYSRLGESKIYNYMLNNKYYYCFDNDINNFYDITEDLKKLKKLDIKFGTNHWKNFEFNENDDLIFLPIDKI